MCGADCALPYAMMFDYAQGEPYVYFLLNLYHCFDLLISCYSAPDHLC